MYVCMYVNIFKNYLLLFFQTYEIRVLPNSSNQVLVSLIFHNQSNFLLKELELSIIETSYIRMSKEVCSYDYFLIKLKLLCCQLVYNESSEKQGKIFF